MSVIGRLSIFLKVLSLQLVDLGDVLYSLLLKELQLLFKGLVPSRL